MRARRAEWLLAVASLSGLASVVLLGEWAARRRDPGYFERRHDNAVDRLHEYSEVYGWAPRAGARARERGQEVVLNAQGYRGPEGLHRHGSRPRLLLLGDSTAFGYGVADDQTYARRVESGGFEVLNLGVLGYGPDQALLKLEHEGLAYASDVIVFSLCVDNDFADARSPVYLYDGRHPKPFFTLEAGQLRLHDQHLRLSAAERLGLWLSERSQIYARLLALLPAPAPVVAWRTRRAQLLADEGATVELMLRLLERMRDDAAGQQARFLVLAHPSKDSYNRGSPLWDALRGRLRERELPALDLAEAYHERGRHFAELALDPTGHLSPAGHALAGELLLGQLRLLLATTPAGG